jgi:hypothetical protein
VTRRVWITALIAAAFLASAAAEGNAASRNSTTNFATTVVIPMTFQGGGSAGFGIRGQTTDAYQRIGRASVDGEFVFGACNIFGCTYSSMLSLAFTTPSGDMLTLIGSVVGSPTPVAAAGTGTWSVDSGTGRFASFTGSGTYSYTVQPTQQAPYLATIALTGTLRHDDG